MAATNFAVFFFMCVCVCVCVCGYYLKVISFILLGALDTNDSWVKYV